LEEFNALYSLAQRLLNDSKIAILVAVFEAEVRLCNRQELNDKFRLDGKELKMINGSKQITIKIK